MKKPLAVRHEGAAAQVLPTRLSKERYSLHVFTVAQSHVRQLPISFDAPLAISGTPSISGRPATRRVGTLWAATHLTMDGVRIALPHAPIDR